MTVVCLEAVVIRQRRAQHHPRAVFGDQEVRRNSGGVDARCSSLGGYRADGLGVLSRARSSRIPARPASVPFANGLADGLLDVRANDVQLVWCVDTPDVSARAPAAR